MSKQTTIRHGGKKGKRSARNKASGKYARQRIRTEANKLRRKKLREGLFSLIHLLHENPMNVFAPVANML
jgi:hypothetical protein